MSSRKSLSIFFNKMDQTYDNAMLSIINFIESGAQLDTAHLEVNFILKLVNTLRLHFKQDSEYTFDILEEILKGGHLKFEDQGLFYDELVALYKSNLHKRNSSHHSCVQQYSFSGPVVKEVLFGVSLDTKKNKATWIQFEKHNTRSIINFILHVFDYLIHKMTGLNIGPYGSSKFTENNPIVLSVN